MSQKLIPQRSADKTERILLSGHFYRKSRFFAVFLICTALLVAGFASTGVWMSRGGGEDLKGLGSFTQGEETTNAPPQKKPEDETTSKAQQTEKPSPTPIPEGAIPVIDADLSCESLGEGYFHNATAYRPDVQVLLQKEVSSVLTDTPLVLILHTHASESYLREEQNFLAGDLGEASYSQDPTKNMLAVGKALCETLNQKGITAIHCTVMHDAPTLSGSYARALESIRFYLTHYPSIRYVIDLHRDSILNADGEYIRTEASLEGERLAQVMPVVGSDGGGEANDRWEGNLALALQLRAALNESVPSLCRPVDLRMETYNQELAPFSLLLEIGSGGNSLEEALRAIRIVGECLAELITP